MSRARCVGALFFGWLADRPGRKKLFLITLALYLVATVATAFSTTFLMFAICRSFTGAGIGGEYAAINSAINVGFLTVAKTVFGAYPRRTIVGLALFVGQAFLYNAVFFTYALVLGTFYDVKPASVGWYIIPFAIGNFLGPLVLGRLFSSPAAKPMIAGTYIVSGVLLIITAFLFKADV